MDQLTPQASAKKWHVLTWQKGSTTSPEEWHESLASAFGGVFSRALHGWGMPATWTRKVDPDAVSHMNSTPNL